MKKKNPTDRERLDWLEKFVQEHHSLTLHDGNIRNHPMPGAGLCFGGIFLRSLRDAIDSAARELALMDRDPKTGRLVKRVVTPGKG
jgi:hypothetical protein